MNPVRACRHSIRAIVAAIPGRYGEDVLKPPVRSGSIPAMRRRLPAQLGAGVRGLALAIVTATLLSGVACRPDPSPSELARHDPHAMDKLEETDVAHVETVYRRKSTGAAVTLRPAAAFAARFSDVPLAELAARGREAMELPADPI